MKTSLKVAISVLVAVVIFGSLAFILFDEGDEEYEFFTSDVARGDDPEHGQRDRHHRGGPYRAGGLAGVGSDTDPVR